VTPVRRFVVVSGPPGSGKSTLAAPLAARLGLPLVAKDTIKEALMDVLDVPDIEASRQIGRAAMAVLFAVAADSPIGAVVESNFYRSLAIGSVADLPGSVVEVFCRCDRAVAAARYAERAEGRAAGHFDGQRSPTDIWNDEIAGPIAGGWPVVEVDTTRAVDLDGLVAVLGVG
jgi:predicted kinase